jgi:hypothetical protein
MPTDSSGLRVNFPVGCPPLDEVVGKSKVTWQYGGDARVHPRLPRSESRAYVGGRGERTLNPTTESRFQHSYVSEECEGKSTHS